MGSLTLQIILIVVSAGLFFEFTDPIVTNTNNIKKQVATYEQTLASTRDLVNIRDTLLEKKSSFSADSMAKLGHLLPDNVDNVRLIMDINSIALSHNLIMKNIKLSELSDSPNGGLTLGGGKSGVGSINLGFSVNAKYENILPFIRDLEDSLRMVDIVSIDFKSPDPQSGQSDYNFTIRTYWLK